MDPRSIKPGLLAVSMVHPTLRDPKTGEPLVALGTRKDGRLIWPVIGAAPDDDDSGGGDDDTDDKDDADEEDEDEGKTDDKDDDKDDEDEDDDKGKKGKKKKPDPEARIRALEDEKQRHFKKAKRLAVEKAELEARLTALEDKTLKPEEKEQRRKEEQEAKDAAATAATQRLKLENAFLRANDIDWVKPEQALTLLLGDDDYEVEFNADGSVDRKSLRVELKRLAKANPHLVKAKQSKADDDEDVDDDGGSKSTASSMNGQRKGKKNAKSRAELAKRFPVLNKI